jgi:hypothetical protein
MKLSKLLPQFLLDSCDGPPEPEPAGRSRGQRWALHQILTRYCIPTPEIHVPSAGIHPRLCPLVSPPFSYTNSTHLYTLSLHLFPS